MEKNPGFRIGEHASIPDDDMVNWVNTLHEAGFTEEEMDGMLAPLNETYGALKGDPRIEKDLAEIDAKTLARRGSGLTDQEKEYFRNSIKERYK